MEQKRFKIIRRSVTKPLFVEPFDEIEGHQLFKRRYQAYVFVLHHKSSGQYLTIEYCGFSPFSHERLIEYIIDLKPQLNMAMN